MREWHEEETEDLDFISRRVLQLLKEHKIKLAPFARGLGIDPAHFRRFLKGKRRWRMDYLEKVAEGLGMSLQELLTGPKAQPEVLQPIITVVGEYARPPEGLLIDEYFAVPLVEGPSPPGIPAPFRGTRSLPWSGSKSQKSAGASTTTFGLSSWPKTLPPWSPPSAGAPSSSSTLPRSPSRKKGFMRCAWSNTKEPAPSRE